MGKKYSRREFIEYGAIAAIVLTMATSGSFLYRRASETATIHELPVAPRVEAPPTPITPSFQITPYSKTRIATLGELKEGKPIDFRYPLNHPHHDNFVVKLGTPALGGVGSQGDIVAFNYLCTHMGCPLKGLYNRAFKMLGPCPCHFTRFDLTNGGMVIIGQATENLPQIILETENDTVYAIGVKNLIYGFRSNILDATQVQVS